MKEENYRSGQIEGFDNGRMQFVTTSINNHIGSDMQWQTGTYDSASHIFTYFWQSELLRGNKVNNKRTLKVIDRNHYIEEYFEEKQGVYRKVRELDYTRSE